MIKFNINQAGSTIVNMEGEKDVMIRMISDYFAAMGQFDCEDEEYEFTNYLADITFSTILDGVARFYRYGSFVISVEFFE